MIKSMAPPAPANATSSQRTCPRIASVQRGTTAQRIASQPARRVQRIASHPARRVCSAAQPSAAERSAAQPSAAQRSAHSAQRTARAPASCSPPPLLHPSLCFCLEREVCLLKEHRFVWFVDLHGNKKCSKFLKFHMCISSNTIPSCFRA